METCDILVIGGGMAGISAAARMADTARVIVLEAEASIGYHSTGRSAAAFIVNYGSPLLRVLNRASEAFFHDPQLLGETSLLTGRGELMVARDEDLPALDAYLDGARGIERLDAAQAVALVPILRADRIAAAAYEPAAYDIDVDRMLQGFARLLRARGGRIVPQAQVTALSHQGGVWIATTAQGPFQAPVVVNAAGGWADKLAAMAGVATVGLRPLRRSAAIIPAPGGHDVTRWPLFTGASEDWYAKPEAGKLMVSPADEDPVEPHDVWADDMVIAEGLERYSQMVITPVTRVDHTWAGMRSFVADRNPVVGFAPDADGFLWLAGQGGYGIQTAPALSQLAADLCLGRTSELSEGIVASLAPAAPAIRAASMQRAVGSHASGKPM